MPASLTSRLYLPGCLRDRFARAACKRCVGRLSVGCAVLAKFWRPVPCDIWDRIAEHDHLAQRLYLWLWTGPASQQCGLAILREYEAAGALRTKPVMVRQALDALQDDGLLVVQPAARGRSIVWLDRYLSGQTPVKPEHRVSVLSDIERHEPGNAVSQAIEDWELWDAASRQPVGRQGAASLHRTKQNKTEQNTQNPVLGSRTDGATRPTADASSQSPKRQPRGQGGAKTAKPRSLAQQPPTLEETRAIFAEHNAPASEAQRCLDYWTSAGFRRKAGPIKDWPATCRTWISNWRESGHSYGNRKAQAPLMAFDQADLERQMAEQEREMREAEARGESWF